MSKVNLLFVCNFAQICIVTSMGDVKKTRITLGPLPYLYEKKIAKCCLFQVDFFHHLFYSLSKIFLFIQVIQASFSWQDYHKRLIKWVSLISIFHLPHPAWCGISALPSYHFGLLTGLKCVKISRPAENEAKWMVQTLMAHKKRSRIADAWAS